VRNLDLLEQSFEHGGRASARDWLLLVGAVLAFLAVMGFIAWGIVALFRAVF
jgi:hypothetical protein